MLETIDSNPKNSLPIQITQTQIGWDRTDKESARLIEVGQ